MRVIESQVAGYIPEMAMCSCALVQDTYVYISLGAKELVRHGSPSLETKLKTICIPAAELEKGWKLQIE